MKRRPTALVPRALPPPGPLAARVEPPTFTAADQARVRTLLNDAWADETRRAYGWAWRAFVAWCAEGGRTPLPAAPSEVALFIDDQVRAKRSASAVRTMLSALKWIHEAAGYPSPTSDPAVRLGWKAARNRLGAGAAHPKAPLTLDLMARMLAAVDRTTLRGKRDAALLLVGFFGAFRRSELVAIRVEHLKPAPRGLAVFIPRSKTDQAGEGETIGFASREDDLCPVAAIEAWRKAANLHSGRLFPISAGGVAAIVKKYAAVVGLQITDFAGHSLRAGFVTEAYRRGASDAEIAGTTRHKNTATLARYRREADPVARGASERLKDPT